MKPICSEFRYDGDEIKSRLAKIACGHGWRRTRRRFGVVRPFGASGIIWPSYTSRLTTMDLGRAYAHESHYGALRDTVSSYVPRLYSEGGWHGTALWYGTGGQRWSRCSVGATGVFFGASSCCDADVLGIANAAAIIR